MDSALVVTTFLNRGINLPSGARYLACHPQAFCAQRERGHSSESAETAKEEMSDLIGYKKQTKRA